MGALALCQARVEARDAQVRGRNARSVHGIAELMRRAGAAPAAPAFLTGRSHFVILRGRGPAAGCRFASPGGRRGDVPSELNERTLDVIILTRGSAADSLPILHRDFLAQTGS